jgi:hypothetical protein
MRASAGAPPAWRHPAVLGLLLLALLVRLPPCFGDLWLDEIWSLLAARELRSPLGAFTELESSNNHPLNTLFLQLVGPSEAPLVLRLHSLAAGVGAVALAWLAGRRGGAAEGLLAALLTACSYLLIHFSSEARGYALAVFFAFAALLAARRFAEAPSWSRAALLWLCTALGFLSHLTFLYAFLAVGAASAAELRSACGSQREAARELARGFAPPLAGLGLYYALVLRHLVIGAAPPYALLEVLVRTLSGTGGGPGAGPLALAASLVTAGLVVAAIARLWRRSPGESLLFAIGVFLAPAAVLAALRPEVLAVQYFVVDAALALLALASLLAEGWRRGRGARLAVAAALLLFLVGNGANVLRLYRFGRGSYAQGLRYLADRTPEPVITVTSDHDARTGVLLQYYEPRLRLPKRIDYLPGSLQFPVEALAEAPDPARPLEPAPGAAWILLHRIGEAGEIAPAIADRHGTRYALAKTLPYAGVSGWHWFLYRKQGRPARP